MSERFSPAPSLDASTRRQWLAVTVLGLFTACSAESPPPAVVTQPDFQPTASVQDLMRWMIDPPADALWDAVVTTVTGDGIEEVRPETDGDWRRLERQAILLVEAGNLLQIGDRRIASEESESALPGIDLAPEEIAVLVAENRNTWLRLARELHDAGVVILTAIRAHDVNALLKGGDRLDVACENCHARFWYPPVPGGGRDGREPVPLRARNGGSSYGRIGVPSGRVSSAQHMPNVPGAREGCPTTLISSPAVIVSGVQPRRLIDTEAPISISQWMVSPASPGASTYKNECGFRNTNLVTVPTASTRFSGS